MILKREYALYDANPRYGIVNPERAASETPHRSKIGYTDEDDPQRSAFIAEVLKRIRKEPTS